MNTPLSVVEKRPLSDEEQRANKTRRDEHQKQADATTSQEAWEKCLESWCFLA
jgi:hypothetical protein